MESRTRFESHQFAIGPAFALKNNIGGIMKSTQTTLLALSLAMSLLSACAQPNESSTELASRDPGGTPSTSTKPLAACNKGSNANLTLSIRTYADNGSTTARNDLSLGMFSNVNESFVGGTEYIRLFRWKAKLTTGAYELDPTPLQFRLYKTDGTAVTDDVNFLRWNQVSGAGYTTAASLFSQTRVLINLRDVNADYHAISVVYYSGANAVLSNHDMLIPLFAANPADYTKFSNGNTRPGILQNLHPFKSMIGQGDAKYFQDEANKLCF